MRGDIGRPTGGLKTKLVYELYFREIKDISLFNEARSYDEKVRGEDCAAYQATTSSERRDYIQSR